jgi:hypothetical protein
VNPKITDLHLRRRAVIYVRQSTPGQVAEHTESKRRQYDLADVARGMGFVDVITIDEDLGRSGSGLTGCGKMSPGSRLAMPGVFID